MTISDLVGHPPTQLFVWIWLPDAAEPVLCGRLDEGRPITFTYARAYRERENAVAIYSPELALDADRALGPP